jgi:PAS domain S-box-containing protein
MTQELTIEKLIAQLFDQVSDSVIWVYPVEQKTKEGFNDFELRYCNEAARKEIGKDGATIIGSHIFSSPLIGEDIQLTLKDIFIKGGESEMKEYIFHNLNKDTYIHVHKRNLGRGFLCITRDCTAEQKAIAHQHRQEEMYKEILNTTADGIMLLKALRDEQENIIDFRLEVANTKALELGQIREKNIGKTLLDLFPHLRDSDQFYLHKQVVESGEPLRFETSFRTPVGNEYGWFIVSLTRFGDGVISNFVDVTEKKQYEQQVMHQKDLLNKILDSSLGGIITCEAVYDEHEVIKDFRLIQVNDKFRQMLHNMQVEVVGSKLFELFPVVRQSGLMEKLADVIRSGKSSRFELQFPLKSSYRWYDMSVEKIGAKGIVISFADITHIKRAAIELETQKKLLDNILEQAANGVAVHKAIRDESGRIIDFQCLLANAAMSRLTGIPNEIRLIRTVRELFAGVADAPSVEHGIRALESGKSYQAEFYYKGVERWIEFSASPMDADHLVEIFTDISAIKQTQLQLQYSVNELRQFNQNLEEFTRSASHDLQEPIRKVQFFADRLGAKLESKMDASEKDLLQRLVNATNRMKLLVDDLLDYAHTNQLQLQPEEVDLNSKLRQVVGDLELLIQQKDAIINIGPLPVVKGYRRQLQQLFQNLVTNSLKYTRQDVPPVINITSFQTTGEESTIPVSAEDRKMEYYLFKIQDNGIGFEQKESGRIFNMFTRLHGNSEYSGTGVGLAIVKKVVENHNGYIKAEGHPGEGATFSILLPI